jgi:hypothetical protein
MITAMYGTALSFFLAALVITLSCSIIYLRANKRTTASIIVSRLSSLESIGIVVVARIRRILMVFEVFEGFGRIATALAVLAALAALDALILQSVALGFRSHYSR